MKRRFILLLALFALVGFATHAFGQSTDAPVTRAAAVKLLIESNDHLRERAEWYRSHMPSVPLFDDVDQSSWYAPYVETAFEEGIITGNLSTNDMSN